jgi:hypothetical protein
MTCDHTDKSRVLNTVVKHGVFRRRRECLTCGTRFVTLELQVSEGRESTKTLLLVASRVGLLNTLEKRLNAVRSELRHLIELVNHAKG